jgi:hypothetical protein
MVELVHAVPAVQAIHVVARLGVSDVLSRGPRTAEELATEVGAHGPSLRRILRFLTNMDIFAEDAIGRFSLTPLAALLQRGVPGSVHQAALHCGEPWTWRKWGELHHTVRTGEPGFEKAYGMPFFDFLATNPDARTTFDGLMKELSASQIPPILAAYDFSGFRKIVDVGGGHGQFLNAILAKHPSTLGILYDLPEVAKALAVAGGPPRGVEVLTGTFFESVPPGGDAYLLKWILHDWDDEAAVRILANCRRAMSDTATLLVVEMVIPEVGRHESKAMDVFMMVTLPGRERTQAEFRDLFRAAGFDLTRVVPAGAMSVLEARPTRTP